MCLKLEILSERQYLTKVGISTQVCGVLDQIISLKAII